jgi:hypothetical protein
MFAHALLVVAAVTDRTRHSPPPPGLVWLICNEVQHLFAALLARPSPVTSATGCAGLCGDAGNRPALRPVTTAGKPTDHEDHDLQLAYSA